MARKNLKVPEDLFHALRDDKDDQQSWPHYLEEQCLHDESGDVQSDPEAIAREFARVFDYEAAADRAAERTADKLEGRLR